MMLDILLVKPRIRLPNPTLARILEVLTIGAGVALAFSACGDPVSVTDPADIVLHVVSGDSQIGIPYEELPDPIVVQVVDTANNTPVFNQVINFRVVDGGGSVYAGVAHTNEGGVAQEYWTLGEPGPQVLEARAVTGEGEKVVFGTFHATAIEPFDSVPAYIQCLNTEPTWRPIGECEYGVHWVDSAVTASFRVVNADAIPIPDILVRFAVDTNVDSLMQQGGSVFPDSALTDSLGTVTVTWTLGPYPGDNVLMVSAYGSGEVKSVFAWAYGVNPPPPHDTVPAHIRCLAENSWWRYDGECAYGPAPVNTTIPVTFQVVARDTTPLPNIQMYFTVDTTVWIGSYVQNGSVTPYSALTDSAGTATVMWTLGQYAGENRLIAYAVGSGVTLTNTVTAIGVADSIPIDSVPAMIQCKDYYGVWRNEGNCAYASVPAGTAFPATFRVTNRDTVPLAGVGMEFEITEGDGAVSPQARVTDSIGEVTVIWTVGSYNVGQRLTARVRAWQLEVSVWVGVYQPMPEKVWWENQYGGDWTDSTNWSGGRVPRSGDTVVVRLAGDYQILAESDDTLSMGSLELGTFDTNTTQTLYIDRTVFHVDWFNAVHPGGVIKVDSGATYLGEGLMFVVGGEVRVIDGTWDLYTRLDSGAFAFEGVYAKTLGGMLMADSGAVTWNSADSLLFLTDSAGIYLRAANLSILDTLTILGGDASFGLTADTAATILFTANAATSTYVQMNGVRAMVNGKVAIEASAEPPPGTVFDLIRLIGGATFTGTPTLATEGYTLVLNPEAGVGLRAIKN